MTLKKWLVITQNKGVMTQFLRGHGDLVGHRRKWKIWTLFGAQVGGQPGRSLRHKAGMNVVGKWQATSKTGLEHSLASQKVTGKGGGRAGGKVPGRGLG